VIPCMPAGYRPVCLPYLYISSSLSGTWVYAALKSSVCVPAHGDDTGPSLVTLFFCGALVVIELKVKRHLYVSIRRVPHPARIHISSISQFFSLHRYVSIINYMNMVMVYISY